MILDAIWSHLLLLYITGKVGQFVLFGMWLLCILHRVATYISWCGVLWMQLIPKEADCYYACELQRTTVKPSRRHFFLTKVRPATQKLLSGFVQTEKYCFPGLSGTCKDQIPGFSRSHKTRFQGLSRINSVHKHGCIRSKKCTYQISYQCNCITVKKPKCNNWNSNRSKR